MTTVKLVYANRWNLLHFLRHLPKLFFAEVRYLTTGIELDVPIQDSRPPFTLPCTSRNPLPKKRATL